MSERETEEERREPIEWASLYGERPDDGDRFGATDQHHPYELERGYQPIHPEPAWRVLLRRLSAPLIALGLLIWKFKFAVFAIFKLKIFTVAGSMIVSIAAYALLWGWKFAVGFVLLLLVHELGHALEAKRQGLAVSAPLFIPFLGAVIALKQMPHDVWKEAQMAIAGPILGSLGCLVCWGLAAVYDSDLLMALAFTGFLLNLFNLAPVSPLDGGRIVAAIHPAIWGLGLVLLAVLTVIAPNPILILILVVGGLEVWRRWRERGDPKMAEYYSISPAKRVVAAVAYVGLAVLLAVAMDLTYIQRDL